MGNQRQVLKGNIEKELTLKIETAKDVLEQLNRSLEASKEQSFGAKQEITVTADLLQELLSIRKNELMREIDSLHNAQVKSLQDAIRSTYISMGKLQNMLTNLDSFDQSQLVNIRVPEVDTSFTMEPAQIIPSVECESLKGELKEWGNVTLDGFQFMDSADDFGLIHKKRISVSTTDSENFPSASQSSQKAPETELKNPMTWSIENWLWKSNQKDVVPSPEDSRINCLDLDLSDDEMDFVVPVIEPMSSKTSSVSNPAVICDDESGSSILCIERESQQLPQEDLSVWLKPRKAKALQQSSQKIHVCAPILQNSTENKENNVAPAVSGAKRILEFPCLLLKDENWIREKKCKSSSGASNCSTKTNNSFLESQKHLTPPAYALPNPFWLKKYQIR